MSQSTLALLTQRYGAVFQSAWALRHELAGPKRLADEAAFLPAAMSLQATPPHPAPRRAAWVLMALFSLAILWSVVGQVDIVATAPGRVVVSQRTKVIQPLEPAVVKAIHVRDGSHVQAGELLIELDPTGASADGQSVEQERLYAQADARRAEALLGALGGTQAAPPGDQQLRAEWAQIRARLAQLEAEALRRQAEAHTHAQALAKLDATLPLALRREADFKSLQEQGFVAGHAGQDRSRERIELERDRATQQARVAEAQAAFAESRQAQAAYEAETRRELQDRVASARLKAAQLAQQATKATQRERQTRLTAPVSGTVQQLAINTEGGVVTEAQPLMVIVPDDAELTAEVTLDNKDIGFVRPGQEAEIKLETFSFTRYGTVPAMVQFVSADAVQDERRGAVFTARLTVGRGAIDIDGKNVTLTPGMNLSAEIHTGRRRVVDYLLSPLQSAVDQSFRER